MTVVFDFSKESNDYRQRIAVVFKSLFEREFLENFDIVLKELFNGCYSVKSLKEAIIKNKHILLEGESENPVIRKKKENEKFANEAIKMIILVMMLGEEYIKLKDILSGVETHDNITDSLGLLNYIVSEIANTRDILKKELTQMDFGMSQRSRINEELKSMDDIITSCCLDIRVLVVDKVLSLSDIDNEARTLAENIIEEVAVIVEVRDRAVQF